MLSESLIIEELPRVFNLALRLCQDETQAEALCEQVFASNRHSNNQKKQKLESHQWFTRLTVTAWKRLPHPKRSPLKPLPWPTNRWGEATKYNKELYRAFSLLTPDEKIIIALRDMENWSVEDISLILGIRRGRIAPRLAKARDQLREFHYRSSGART